METWIDLWKTTIKHDSCKIDCYFRKTQEEAEALASMNKAIWPEAEIKVEKVRAKNERK